MTTWHSANIGARYIETLQPQVIYRAICVLIDQKLQNKCKMNDISQTRALYQILQVGNLQKLAKMENFDFAA